MKNTISLSSIVFAVTLSVFLWALAIASGAGAVTFDSDIRASSSGSYAIGTAAGDWPSLNNTLFFNGTNVMMGGNSPIGARLRVVSGELYVSDGASGVIFHNGSCWRITVNESGAYQKTSISCP